MNKSEMFSLPNLGLCPIVGGRSHKMDLFAKTYVCPPHMINTVHEDRVRSLLKLPIVAFNFD